MISKIIESMFSFFIFSTNSVSSLVLFAHTQHRIILGRLLKFHPNLFYCWTFSNLPNIILCWVWANNTKELTELVENIKKENIDSIIFDIMYKVYYFDTWKEKLLYK